MLEFSRSPFFEDLMMTVHDFHFAIWDISLIEYEEPIFRSSYTQGAQNTTGVWSPTRPGVIFIGKTNGVDIWDFCDQSHKASLSIPNISSPITRMVFQDCSMMKGFKHQHNAQYLGFGEQNDGTIFLYRVPTNLKNPQGEEFQVIKDFWNREIDKCLYQKKRKELRVEERDDSERNKMIEEAKRADEIIKDDEDSIREAEMLEESKFNEVVMSVKFEFGIISE